MVAVFIYNLFFYFCFVQGKALQQNSEALLKVMPTSRLTE